jgi:aminoglycoside phosphotransferase (APT) family kinase protein
VPSPIQRDPAATSAALASWLERTLPEAAGAVVTRLDAPPSSGFSGETILLDADWGGEPHELVVRVAPTTYTVFLEPHFEAQFRTMKILSEQTDVPMPEMLAYESDTSILGAPFSLMRRVEGEAAPDSPAYTDAGWIKDATPDQQAALYESGLSAMARIHGLDWRALGLQFLERDELDYVERYHAWARDLDGGPNPIMDEAMAWLRSHPVKPVDEPALCWGDSRPGNQLFRDWRCVAVLDWEMVTIGDPIMDLAWWLFLERFHTVGSGFPLPPGFPGEAGAIARWSELTGREVDPEVFRYYLVFAGIRFGIVMIRLATLFKEFEIMPAEADMARNNPVLHVLKAILDESA